MPEEVEGGCTTHDHHDHAPSDNDHCSLHDHEGDAERLANITIPKNFKRATLIIEEMDCPVEGAMIRERFEGDERVDELYFNYLKRELHLVYQGELSPLIEEIETLGMNPYSAEAGAPLREKSWSEKHETLRLVISGVSAAIAELLHFTMADGSLKGILTALFALVAIAFVGLGTYKKGWISLKNGQLNINALMSVAVTGAFLLGEFPEAAMVMFLFTLSEVIEAKSLGRAQNAIEKLLSLTPDEAKVIESDGTLSTVAVDKIEKGAHIRLLPGERIPLDGVVLQGVSSVDESPITGESIPVDKLAGAPLYAGSINQQGELEYETTADAEHSTLAKIINTIEEAQGKRAPVERFVDRFAALYTPIVFFIAIAIAIFAPFVSSMGWHESIYNALVVLIIACPCALVISTPVSIVSALTALARHGILVKGGEYLEEGSRLTHLAFDKTGTITKGRPTLVEKHLFADEAVLEIAYRMADRSDHPVSRAIAEGLKAEYQGAQSKEITNFEAILGSGVTATLDGKQYYLANGRYLAKHLPFSEEIVDLIANLEGRGDTLTLLSDEERLLALFSVSDEIKEESREAIKALHQLDLKTTLLSGDNRRAVAHIAKEVGIDEAKGALLPHDKVSEIERIKAEGDVGMIGDGINDAPALATANIGFAMGAIGTDVAIETANVALMDDDLSKLPFFIESTRKTMRIIRQNIAFALGVKALFFILVLLNMGSMWMAVFADVGTSLLVVLNGLRLLRLTPKK